MGARRLQQAQGLLGKLEERIEHIGSAAEAAAQRRKEEDAQIEDAKKHLKSDVDFRSSVRFHLLIHVWQHDTHAMAATLSGRTCSSTAAYSTCSAGLSHRETVRHKPVDFTGAVALIVVFACAGVHRDGGRSQQPGIHGRGPGGRAAKAAAMKRRWAESWLDSVAGWPQRFLRVFVTCILWRTHECLQSGCVHVK